MVIAFVLMGLILVATPWVYKRLGLTPAQPNPAVKSAVETSAASVKGDAVKPMPSAQADTATGDTAPAVPTSATTEAASESTWNLDTSLYHLVFSIAARW